jgi:hypothetical protein
MGVLHIKAECFLATTSSGRKLEVLEFDSDPPFHFFL